MVGFPLLTLTIFLPLVGALFVLAVRGTEEEVARFWCERSGIPYLGRADIGHDADNKIVPFGRFSGA